MVVVFASILKVKGSNLISGVCMVNNGKLTKYSFIQFPKVGAQVPISIKDLIATSWILFRFINSHKLILCSGLLKAYTLMKPISPHGNQLIFKILTSFPPKVKQLDINHAHLRSIKMQVPFLPSCPCCNSNEYPSFAS